MNNLLSLFLFFLLISSCSKNDDGNQEDPGQPLIYTSLTAERDTIESGETTKVTAIATGYKLSFHWSATAGDILGTGNQVIYAASPCQAGKNKLTCTVSDGNNNSKSKEIFIVVK